MTEPSKVADTTDARQASMSRVVTQETLLANLKPAEAASEPAEVDTPAQEQQAEGDKPKGKKSAQERIVELAEKRREAEEKAEAKERENAELKSRLDALEAAAKPVISKAPPEPKRADFATEEEFIGALTDWKADRALERREQQQRENQQRAEFEALDNAFNKRLEQTIKEVDDYKDVVGSATVEIPDFIVMAIKESEQGPMLVYYLASNPEEAKQLTRMRPVVALKRLIEIERDLSTDQEDEPKKVEPPKAKRAPEPITPLKGSQTPNPAPAKTYAEYKARRIAEKQ